MTQPKLTPEQDAAFRRRLERLLRDMNDGDKAFLYHQPDVLKLVFGGELREYFEKLRRVIPPVGKKCDVMEDAAGWMALEKGKALMSARTYVVDVDYRPDRDDALLAAKVFDDPFDTESLEDMMARRKIVRAGGYASRFLKRVWFEGDACVSELDGLIRLKGWSTVDARTLLAWSCLNRHGLELHESVSASAMPLLKRDGNSVRLTSSITRQRDSRGEYFSFKRGDAGLDTLSAIFSATRSFLVEVPDERV